MKFCCTFCKNDFPSQNLTFFSLAPLVCLSQTGVCVSQTNKTDLTLNVYLKAKQWTDQQTIIITHISNSILKFSLLDGIFQRILNCTQVIDLTCFGSISTLAAEEASAHTTKKFQGKTAKITYFLHSLCQNQAGNVQVSPKSINLIGCLTYTHQKIIGVYESDKSKQHKPLPLSCKSFNSGLFLG